MGALSLTSDFDESLQSHLDELSVRMGRVLFGIIFCTAVVAYFSASLISWYLDILSPCPPVDCLRIYKPTDWMATRWLSALLISTTIMLPLLSREIYLFSHRGLLPSERRWLYWILVLGPLMGLFSVFSTLLWILPYINQNAHDFGLIEGVVARYGAVDMIRFALILSGVELVILFATLSTLFAITFKLLDKSNVMGWRFRIYSPSFIIMWLIVPFEFEGMLFLSLCSEILLVESLMYFPSKSDVRVQKLAPKRGILDSDARLRRIGIVGCSCCGVVEIPEITSIPSGMVYLRLPDFCTSSVSQDKVIENVFQMKLTDLITTGCDLEVIDSKFLKSLRQMDCEFRTFTLIDYCSMRTSDSNLRDIDFKVRLAIATDPWNEKKYERVISMLNSIDNLDTITAYWTTSERPPFGTNLSSHEILITSVDRPSSDIVSKFASIGVSLENLHQYLTN